MMNLLDKKFLEWVSKNKNTFLMVVLLMGNIYQYLDKERVQQRYEDYIKQQNEYWKQRSEKLEFLFGSLMQIEKPDKKSK